MYTWNHEPFAESKRGEMKRRDTYASVSGHRHTTALAAQS